jgi:hypothetical protein
VVGQPGFYLLKNHCPIVAACRLPNPQVLASQPRTQSLQFIDRAIGALQLLWIQSCNAINFVFALPLQEI